MKSNHVKMIALAAAMVLALCGLAACGGGQDGGPDASTGAVHSISVAEGDERDVFNYPATARAGEVVTFETSAVTDADLYANVTGADVERLSEMEWQFTMPDQDVVISVTIDTSNYPGA